MPKVLVTRPEEDAKEFTDALAKHGIDTMLFPTIRIIDPESWKRCDELLRQIESFDALIFTSRNAVRKFIARAEELGVRDRLKGIQVYAIGEKTADELLSNCIPSDTFDEGATGRELGRAIADELPPASRVLIPHSSLARNDVATELTKAHIDVSAVQVYRTEKFMPLNVNEVISQLRSGAISLVAFFSPSAVENFAELLPEFFQGKILIGTIGRTTADACLVQGWRVDLISSHPSSEIFAEEIVNKIL